MSRRNAVLLVAVVATITIALLVTWALRAQPYVRDRVVAAINERFDSQVALESLSIDLLPRPRASGAGFTLRHNGRTDVPPLITIAQFGASAHVLGLTGQPIELASITLNQLNIHMPPGGLNPDGRNAPDEGHVAHDERPSPIIINEIESRQARLEIASRRPGRLPRVFEIHDLVMQDFGRPQGARFHAGVTNPVPRGRIETSGTFGPWHADEPRLTPVSGDYVFKEANLDVIKGIGGVLSSVGRYSGILDRIEVEGQTDTPDFSLDLAGRPVPLATTFRAIVDGTNGDTWLERVDARLGKTMINASGAIVRTQEVKGRHISLDVAIAGGQLEDLMDLAVKAAKPPLVGRIDLKTKMVLPAGDGDVLERLQLDGSFSLAQATFTNVDVQKRITMLSERGRGDEHADGVGQSVVSQLTAQFTLRDGQLDFKRLSFGVPGAVVQLAGTYHLRTEVMAFRGDLLVDASLADMTSGFKSLLVRMAQPLFRRPGGGSRVPIRITGTRERANFGLDTGRVFRRS
jgi:hypothetical protein